MADPSRVSNPHGSSVALTRRKAFPRPPTETRLEATRNEVCTQRLENSEYIMETDRRLLTQLLKN